MATTRKSKAEEAKDVEVVEADQTPEEAEEAAALVAEHEAEQTAGETETAADSDASNVVEAVPADDEEKPKGGRIRFVRGGLMVGGRIYAEGDETDAPDTLYSQTEKAQRESYGDVFFKKA